MPTFKLEEEEESDDVVEIGDSKIKYGVRMSKTSFGFQVYRVDGPIMYV